MMLLSIFLLTPIAPYIQAEEKESSIPVVSGELVSHPELFIEPEIITKAEEPLSADIRCNCYAYQKHSFFPSLPNTQTILSNLDNEIGDLAVFYYPQSGLYHYAKVLESDGYNITIDESNYHHCQVSQRVITTDYPYLLGFWTGNS